MKSLDTQVLRDIVQFEKLSRCRVVDSSFDGETLYLVVRTKNIYDVIGPRGEGIRKLSDQVGHKLKLFVDTKNPERFASNLFQKKAKRIEIFEEDGKKVLKALIDAADRSFVYGKKGSNIKIIGEFLKRKFDIDDVRVVQTR